MHRNPLRAFGLVELLVVVGTIAVVSAIAFPVFLSAKESGRSASCTSNLHQLSVAVLLYVENWEGPPPIGDPSNSWENLVGMARKKATNASQPYAGILRCPSYSSIDGDDHRSGYALNSCYPPAKLQIPEPSGSVLLAEVAASRYLLANGSYEGLTQAAIDLPDSYFERKEFFRLEGASSVRPIGKWGSLRHSERGHYAMIDGHVASFAPSQFAIPVGDKLCRLNAKQWEGPKDGPRFALLVYEK